MTAIQVVDFDFPCCSVDYSELLLANVADAILPETIEERTDTACNAIHCTCTEWADGPMIAGYPSCHVCTHTKASHKRPGTDTKRVKR